MKVVYHGELTRGATSLHRFEAFQELGEAHFIGNAARLPNVKASIGARVCARLRLPLDIHAENERLLAASERERPDVVYVDNSRVIRADTLRRLRDLGVAALAYYSPDDMAAPHNLSIALRNSLPLWDVIFTTKSYNVGELQNMGARRPRLIGNAYHPLHRPLSPEEVGDDFERFDCVFAGTFEPERAHSLIALAEVGISVVIYGQAAGLLHGNWSAVRHQNITVRSGAFDEAYVRALHHGKIALGFLRKLNRDRITTRSIEIPACGRPMLAERTPEHDEAFAPGVEYVGFADDTELIAAAQRLLDDPPYRKRIGEAGRARCISSGYSTAARARFLMDELASLVVEQTIQKRMA